MSGIDCTQFRHELDEGEASASARAHAARCAACARLLAAEDGVRALFAVPAGGPAPAPRGFAAQVMARVARTPQVAPAPVAPVAMPGSALPWWVRAIARPEGAIAFATAGLALLFSPQILGLARVVPQWSAAVLGTLALYVSPWLTPVLERSAGNPLVGAGVACAFLPVVALASWALFRLGMQVARVRLVPAPAVGRRP